LKIFTVSKSDHVNTVPRWIIISMKILIGYYLNIINSYTIDRMRHNVIMAQYYDDSHPTAEIRLSDKFTKQSLDYI
jgi:uncharacterized membrane protein (DUF106 family)